MRIFICPQCRNATLIENCDMMVLECTTSSCEFRLTREEINNSDSQLIVLFFGNLMFDTSIDREINREVEPYSIGLMPEWSSSTQWFLPYRSEIDYKTENADAPTIEEMWQKMEALGIVKD